MNRFKKLAMTVAALAALAVGGAAFAQAQGGSSAAPAPAQHVVAEGEHNDGPDSATEADAPEGPGDPADAPGAGHESEND
jgi:hypothetical protein